MLLLQLTAERLGYGTFAGNGWDDLEGTLSWGPLVAIFGVVLAVSMSMAVVGVRRVAFPAFVVSLFSATLALWQWVSIGRLSADVTGQSGLGLAVWLGTALVGLATSLVVAGANQISGERTSPKSAQPDTVIAS